MATSNSAPKNAGKRKLKRLARRWLWVINSVFAVLIWYLWGFGFLLVCSLVLGINYYVGAITDPFSEKYRALFAEYETLREELEERDQSERKGLA